MTIIVQKFGGSSVGDLEKIGRVADKVVATRRTGSDVVVVVSAMGKTTDELLALARQAAAGAPSPEGSEGRTFEPPRRELDMLLSTGERVTMALLSIAIQARGIDAISFTGSQSGIITNDRHFDARIIEVRPHRIEDELARGRVVIVAGYQGMSYRREITTLGRGGSDTTAVALAAALGAAQCEIYSDVDGVYSADPRVVDGAQHCPELDLALLQEMSEAGAKVMNAQAVEWARKGKITLVARRTADAIGDVTARATVARDAHEEPSRAAAVRAIVGLDRALGLAVTGPDVPRLRQACATLDLRWASGAIDGRGAVAAVSLLNVPDWAGLRDELRASCGPSLQLAEGLGLVSVVGHGLDGCADGVEPFGEVLRASGAEAWATFVTPLRLSALVPRGLLAPLERALHARFVRPA